VRSLVWAILKLGRAVIGRWLETPAGAHRGLERLARARAAIEASSPPDSVEQLARPEQLQQSEAIGAHLRSSFKFSLGSADVRWVLDLATFFQDSFCQHCGTSPDHVHGRCPACAANLTKKLADRRAAENTKPEGP
jgi:hypothetical protein